MCGDREGAGVSGEVKEGLLGLWSGFVLLTKEGLLGLLVSTLISSSNLTSESSVE